MSKTEDPLEHEFDVVMKAAGVDVMPDRRTGALAGYREMKRITPYLRQPRTAADEPANIYSLIPFIRKG